MNDLKKENSGLKTDLNDLTEKFNVSNLMSPLKLIVSNAEDVLFNKFPIEDNGALEGFHVQLKDSEYFKRVVKLVVAFLEHFLS